MSYVNEYDYVERSTDKKTKRNWWMPKYYNHSLTVGLGNITLPKRFEGKKVIFKIEILEETK